MTIIRSYKEIIVFDTLHKNVTYFGNIFDKTFLKVLLLNRMIQKNEFPEVSKQSMILKADVNLKNNFATATLK